MVMEASQLTIRLKSRMPRKGKKKKWKSKKTGNDNKWENGQKINQGYDTGTRAIEYINNNPVPRPKQTNGKQGRKRTRVVEAGESTRGNRAEKISRVAEYPRNRSGGGKSTTHRHFYDYEEFSPGIGSAGKHGGPA